MMRDGDRKQAIDRVCRNALEKESLDLQLTILIDEMAQLIHKICTYRREAVPKTPLNEEVVDEIACVKIMIRKLELGFECEKDVKKPWNLRPENSVKNWGFETFF